MAETAIEWATHVWNPVTGCSRVSPGCAHCYALTYAARLKAMGQPKYQRDGGKGSGPGFGVTTHERELGAPLRWSARPPRRRVFVNSMSDLFHEEVPTLFVGHVLTVIASVPAHDFLVLTKRPDRMRDLLNAYYSRLGSRSVFGLNGPPAEPLPNLWLGVSIENRRFVGRADVLRDTPAAVRFISAEPLLGQLSEPMTHGRHCVCSACAAQDWSEPQLAPCGMHGPSCPPVYSPYRTLGRSPFGHGLRDIDWLIVGGESGPRARRIDPRWVDDLRETAQRSGTAFFFKQWGGRTPKAGGRELDGRTWDELPRARSLEVAHV